MRKWRSSTTQVMEHISLDLHEQSALKNLTDDQSSQHQKALGMVWDVSSDNIFVSIGTTDDPNPTKRGVVSDIARTFDILGWISPTIVCMKILFQHLWELKLGLDDEIPEELQNNISSGKVNYLCLSPSLFLVSITGQAPPGSPPSCTACRMRWKMRTQLWCTSETRIKMVLPLSLW